MSYEAEVMESLKYAIKNEIPTLTRELKKFSSVFGDNAFINTLNESVKAQQMSNLLRLCEISMQRPDLNLLSPSETATILKSVKETIVSNGKTKEESKNKSFFR